MGRRGGKKDARKRNQRRSRRRRERREEILKKTREILSQKLVNRPGSPHTPTPGDITPVEKKARELSVFLEPISGNIPTSADVLLQEFQHEEEMRQRLSPKKGASDQTSEILKQLSDPEYHDVLQAWFVWVEDQKGDRYPIEVDPEEYYPEDYWI